MLSEHFKNISENIEDYVSTFLKIYREADTSANTMRELDSLRNRLEKEKAKREKLLDIYTDGMISSRNLRNETKLPTSASASLKKIFSHLRKKLRNPTIMPVSLKRSRNTSRRCTAPTEI